MTKECGIVGFGGVGPESRVELKMKDGAGTMLPAFCSLSSWSNVVQSMLGKQHGRYGTIVRPRYDIGTDAKYECQKMRPEDRPNPSQPYRVETGSSIVL